MSKYDRINDEMSYKDAEDYIDSILEDLEHIYEEDEPRNGKAGMIWRTIWDKPRKITPMSYFLSSKLADEILAAEEAKKHSLQKANKRARLKISKTEAERDAQLKAATTAQKQNRDLETDLNKARIYQKAFQKGHPEAMKRDIHYLLEKCKKFGISVNYDELESFNLGRNLSKGDSKYPTDDDID